MKLWKKLLLFCRYYIFLSYYKKIEFTTSLLAWNKLAKKLKKNPIFNGILCFDKSLVINIKKIVKFFKT